MKLHRTMSIAAALLTVALAGCAQTEGQQRAGTGALIGGALTVLALWRSRWIELPGALIAVPLGATIGALVGGAFTRDEPPAE